LSSVETPVADLLREHLEEIAEEAAERICGEVPWPAEARGDGRSFWRELSRQVCLGVIHRLEGGNPEEESLGGAFPPGVGPDSVLRALRIVSRVLWSRAAASTEEGNRGRAGIAALAEAIEAQCFDVAERAVCGSATRVPPGTADFNALLDSMRAMQDRDDLVRKMVTGACEVLGFRRAAFFLFEHDMLTPLFACDRLDASWGEEFTREKRAYPLSPLADTPESRAFYGAKMLTAGEMGGGNLTVVRPDPGAFYLLVPINPSGSPRGLLYLEADAGQEGPGLDPELMEAFTKTAAMALENSRLYRELVAKRRVLEQLMTRVNTAHEEERARIARELHDSVAQSLLKIIYTAGFALDFLKEDPRLAVDEIEEVQLRAKECLRELRAIMANLRPTSLDILGLRETIIRYAEQFEEEYAISTSVDLKGLDSLPPPVELAVFRILQEELTNVRKHSHADSVSIRTEISEGDLILTVEDNGVGFDPEALAAEQESGKHLGLMAIRERAELLGGELTIHSTPGMGTRIVVRIPTVSEVKGS